MIRPTPPHETVALAPKVSLDSGAADTVAATDPVPGLAVERMVPSGFGRRPSQTSHGLDKALARAKAEARLLGVVEHPVQAGRFVVLDRLGQGAMGVVYAAFDPRLERKVAIKFVDPSRLGSESGDAQARLEREAKAAADLSHPNIVTVYDVGTHDGSVFLAMEHVPGVTLGEWMAERSRPWRDVLRMFIEIGRGLTAAHEAGIVHRDFKPDNVLVGHDGRPRIADFGLARPLEGWTQRERTTGPQRALPSDGTSVMASTGQVCGTPAYMAPEQFDGQDVGPNSDQFSYCVSLFEALFGDRPFKGLSISDLAARVHEFRIETPERMAGVPRGLLAIIEQGLRPHASDRHPNMDVLVSRLDRFMHIRRQRLVAAGLLGVAAAGLFGGYEASAAQQLDPCQDSGATMDAVWSDTARAALSDELQIHTPGQHDDVMGQLDTYADQWRAEQERSCVATRVTGIQSDFALELRAACFEQSAFRMRGIVDEASKGDVAFRKPAELVALLRPLAECANIEHLERAGDRMRHGQLSPQEVVAHREGLELIAKAETKMLMGRPGADVLLNEALELFEEADFITMQGVALTKLADVSIEAGDYDTAAQRLERASELALATGHDAYAAEASVQAAFVATQQGAPDVAQLHLRYAAGLIRRVPYAPTRELLSAMAGVQRAAVLNAHDDNERALVVATDAAIRLANHAQARPSQVAEAYSLAGDIRNDLGDVPGAIADYALALQRLQATGADGQGVAYKHANLAFSLVLMHAFDRAEAHYEVVETILKRLHGDEHVGLAATMTSRGWLLRERGDLVAARHELERALAMFRVTAPDGHGTWATALGELADVDRLEGRYDEALARLAAAETMRAALFGKHSRGLAFTQVLQARVWIDKGEPAKAQVLVEAALKVFEKPGMAASDLAEAELVLARAVALGDPERAHRIMMRAAARVPSNMPTSARYDEDLTALGRTN